MLHPASNGYDITPQNKSMIDDYMFENRLRWKFLTLVLPHVSLPTSSARFGSLVIRKLSKIVPDLTYENKEVILVSIKEKEKDNFSTSLKLKLCTDWQTVNTQLKCSCMDIIMSISHKLVCQSLLNSFNKTVSYSIFLPATSRDQSRRCCHIYKSQNQPCTPGCQSQGGSTCLCRQDCWSLWASTHPIDKTVTEGQTVWLMSVCQSSENASEIGTWEMTNTCISLYFMLTKSTFLALLLVKQAKIRPFFTHSSPTDIQNKEIFEGTTIWGMHFKLRYSNKMALILSIT